MNAMNVLAQVLFWFVTITTCSSGFGFLFKIPRMYYPECYMVNGEPGTGQTEFEKIATFVFACVYLAPIGGLVYAYAAFGALSEGMMASAMAPLLYHGMSFFGIYLVFGQFLNPAFTSKHAAASIHGFYAILFGLLLWAASHH